MSSSAQAVVCSLEWLRKVFAHGGMAMVRVQARAILDFALQDFPSSQL